MISSISVCPAYVSFSDISEVKLSLGFSSNAANASLQGGEGHPMLLLSEVSLIILF